MSSLKFLKTRLLILVSLILLTFHVTASSIAVTACETCVFPTGGICVGCMSGAARGYQNCTPIQSSCSCNVSGACPVNCPSGYPCDKTSPPPTGGLTGIFEDTDFDAMMAELLN